MANILITGITSGIGNALMKEFLNNGHTVIGCGRDIAKIQHLKTELQGLPCTLSYRTKC